MMYIQNKTILLNIVVNKVSYPTIIENRGEGRRELPTLNN